MNTSTQSFVTHYLRIVLATAMPVFFVAFVSIPYSLGGHPGEPRPTACVTCGPELASLPADKHNS